MSYFTWLKHGELIFVVFWTSNDELNRLFNYVIIHFLSFKISYILQTLLFNFTQPHLGLKAFTFETKSLKMFGVNNIHEYSFLVDHTKSYDESLK